MLALRDLYKLQADYNVSYNTSNNANAVSYAMYLGECRNFVTKNLPPKYADMDANTKHSVMINSIALFIDNHPRLVEGYISDTGPLNELLLEDLYNEISGEGIIKDALDDGDIDEIQINNDNTIYVIKGGRAEYYTDKSGRIRQFAEDKEITTLISKLIDDGTGTTPQFTEGNPLLNAKTAKKQYRVNAVHNSLNARMPAPFNTPVTSVVIRKFKETHLTIQDLINGGTITEEMGRFLLLLGRASVNLFCVGATGSGKTTLLRIIASTIPYSKRMVLIQNPTEISFFETDEQGRMLRNCVHWEVNQSADPNDSRSGTMSNLISNALRVTPDVLIVGESRESSEFAQLQRAMMTGHTTLGTFHADDAESALYRFGDEIKGSGSVDEAVNSVARVVNIIIAQRRFDDGSRKITGITEVNGTDENGKPILNPLFVYETNGETTTDENGIVHVVGKFKRVGVLSDKLVQKFYYGSISKEELREFVEPVVAGRE